ncbi:YbdK family carboxylate-amine ligase [Agrococcus sp. ProA11]|uniref:carboxylate-amine ligase n=1 Tax=Agrococcus chionoecetis TaxID=3153752 RepID=UPI003261966B
MTVTAPISASPRTFGIEEEVILLTPDTLDPVDVADEVIAEVCDGHAVSDWVSAEYLKAQVEFSSPLLTNGDTADRVVRQFRDTLQRAAERRGLLVASVGTTFGGGHSSVGTGERYARFVRTLGAIHPDHRIQGQHVHVAVASADEGVAVMNALRPWLAPLIALTANSPCFSGADTGFASWRTIVGRRFATASVPPAFADGEDYRRRIRGLLGIGTTFDIASIAWMMRLPERYPTLELRVFDAQLTADETVAAALLTRALVETAAAGDLPHAAAAEHHEFVDSAVWHAARHGLEETLVDPVTATLAPAWVVIERMLDAVGPALAAVGDLPRVAALVERARADGNGAARQRAALSEGPAALARLLRAAFVA